jgi:hypothetical protein
MATSLASVLAMVALAPGAARADVDPLRPPEPGAPRYVHRVRRGPLIAGSIVFGISYGVALGVYAASGTDCGQPTCKPTASWLWVPVAGPLLLGGNDGRLIGLELLGTATQLLGLGLIGMGINGETVPATEPSRRPRRRSVTVAPAFTPSLQGLVLAGAF